MLQSMSSTVPAIIATTITDPEKALHQVETRAPSKIDTATIRRTKSLPFFNLRPVPGMQHPKPWDSITRFILTFQCPVVVVGVLGYSFLWYWWVLSVITMVPAAYEMYSPLIQGLLFLGLFIGTLVSEICCSGRLSDWLVERLARRNGNVRVAEMRLWLAYPAILVTAGEFLIRQGKAKIEGSPVTVGLIVWGISIDQNYHWMVGQVAFFLCKLLPSLPHARILTCIVAAGIQVGNTVTSSYIVDSYPLQSTSVVTFYAVFLNLSAFINPVCFPDIYSRDNTDIVRD